jgi:hypothetical protein
VSVALQYLQKILDSAVADAGDEREGLAPGAAAASNSAPLRRSS